MTLIQQDQLPRNSISWLLGSYSLITIAHLYAYLSWWILPIAIISFVWRLQIFRMKMQFPSGYTKAFIVILLMASMYFSIGNFLNTEGFSTLFMCLYTLKFIESRNTRDGYVLVLIGYFSLALLFLFETNILIFAYGLLVFTLNTCSLIGLQLSWQSQQSSKHILITSLQLLGLSIPCMALLFVGFPRLPALLAIPQLHQQQSINKTGISDSMSPGSISDLIQSDEHMFWAEFNNKTPANQDLYWRVLTLDYFDGVTWSQGKRFEREAPSYRVANLDNSQNYNIIYEPTQQKYLASLDTSESLFSKSPLLFLNDFSIQNRNDIETKMRYDLRYIPNTVKELNLINSPTKVRYYTRIPRNSNPKTIKWVQQYPQASSHPEEFVQTILQHFNQNSYYYTLKPPLLDGDIVDEFLFNSRQGFCEHYASSMSFMLRSAGIPSRVVTGYQGGKLSGNNQVQVRSLDAHAWVEYWVPNKGWLRVDPTSAVAPERILDGIDHLINNTDNSTQQQEKTAFSSVLGKFADIKIYLNYQWDKRVLGYQSDNQQSFFNDWFKAGNWRVDLLKYTVLIIIIFMLVVAVLINKPWQRYRFSISAVFNGCLKELQNRYPELHFEQGVTPHEVSHLSDGILTDIELKHLQQLMALIEAYIYQPNSTKAQQQEIRKAVKLFMRNKK